MTTAITTITAEQIKTLRAECAESDHAAEQAEWFINAVKSGDPDAQQYAGNPDLVAALGHQTADKFLGIDLP
ncbi:hypothetical protein [Aquabacterium sp.]|uniref:hypothetical protein n=1 Tax=Aquabacterium sp. TaxID=1872578 RepID=UPI00261288B6|nr:hypothetical protein [Aquabacterium sp.]MDD2978139.1 hypothetical protein [Aquabacterium sp.]